MTQESPKSAYTPWISRVGAAIIDWIPVPVILAIGAAILGGSQETACITDASEYDIGEYCASGASTLGFASFVLAVVCALAYVLWNVVWNHGYRQGATGSSVGKAALKFKVVDEKTREPIGFGMSILRQLVHILDAVCLVGYLIPLWDGKRQTLADKVVKTVCVPI